MQEAPTQYIMWRFAANDDKESLGLKSDELPVDEERIKGFYVSWAVGPGGRQERSCGAVAGRRCRQGHGSEGGPRTREGPREAAGAEDCGWHGQRDLIRRGLVGRQRHVMGMSA